MTREEKLERILRDFKGKFATLPEAVQSITELFPEQKVPSQDEIERASWGNPARADGFVSGAEWVVNRMKK